MARETTEFVTPTDLDAIPDGSTYKKMSATEQTKLGTIEDSATADQTAAEVQAAILAQADADIGLMAVSASTGEKKVYAVHINASGNLEADNEDTAES